MSDKISIVIPVYNIGDKLVFTVNSIIKQTYKNIEIILVDDGSTDKSYSICKELGKKDNRIRVFHTDNQGSGPARNLGIKHATGDYIYFPDADDYVESETLELLMNANKDHMFDLIVFGFRSVNHNGDLLSIKRYQRLEINADEVRKNYYDFYHPNGPFTIQGAPWNKLFDLSVIKNNNVLFPSLRRHQDEAFIARYVSVCSNILFLEKVLYCYYVNDLQRQWDKYPTNYIDSVKGLYNDRLSTIIKWNSSDYKTHWLVSNEYICGFIKALEMTFSPKNNFNTIDRLKAINSMINENEIQSITQPPILGKYQSIVLSLIKNKQLLLLYTTLALKISFEKSGLIRH